ncbi:hypothetical protein [Gilliamella apicola]|uniref:hypothetical protein n=1 Tax=Gilliamella apicola TaxID=1196095 RepID=UPI00080D8FB1|nr:hypothetical protein [Gilliamella apicola]OCG12770.1 hypothetical protein A9G14_04250 [Gilliamella apicola]ORF44837.1 hypothetical protein B5800_10195 [Gilliamella apicola]ORF48057.1 hypothetical protein B5799_10155 [Gilliamella apicola]ORF53178.1 hypothetical protein B5798_09865 [Gilliamella apicola]ORF59865.1 hypothetical protein B5804_09660 [Gilliamella apicola]
MIILPVDAMENKYEIRNSSDQLIFSCNDFIECYDFLGTRGYYWYAFVGVSQQNVNLIIDEETYSINNSQFAGRLDSEFTVQKIIKSHNILYAGLYLSGGMYKRGALSLLKTANEFEERVWLDMKGSLKLIYISASYLKNGFPRTLDKETIVIEGKYIQDYYAFFCELGYAFRGNFGYMGWNLAGVSDLLLDLARNRTINIIWKDSDLSFKAIENTVPESRYQSVSSDIVMTLKEYCNVILE